MKLADLPPFSVGNSIKLIGGIFSNLPGTEILAYFPDAPKPADILPYRELLVMDGTEWQEFLRRGDVVECESKMPDKAILRKSQRTIDAVVQWKVFKRDFYACRYCANSDTPLTVDHIVLWEEGGPQTEQNLITACGKCNRTRGDMPYAKWLASPEYKGRATKLTSHIRLVNESVLGFIDEIPRVEKVRSHR